ncbi:hypothetical protein TNCV_2739121 [Trichonephila clavipes]|nr:hypothetical protein TNCV_2739121 [Trichonephila clavipes]
MPPLEKRRTIGLKETRWSNSRITQHLGRNDATIQRMLAGMVCGRGSLVVAVMSSKPGTTKDSLYKLADAC